MESIWFSSFFIVLSSFVICFYFFTSQFSLLTRTEGAMSFRANEVCVRILFIFFQIPLSIVIPAKAGIHFFIFFQIFISSSTHKLIYPSYCFYNSQLITHHSKLLSCHRPCFFPTPFIAVACHYEDFEKIRDNLINSFRHCEILLAKS